MPRKSLGRAAAKALVALTMTLVMLPVAATHAGAQPEGAQPKIVGGTQAPAGAWPSQVAVLDNRVSGSSAFKAQYCAGTVVNRNWILTAATCVYDEDGTRLGPNIIDVLVGTQNLTSGGQRLHVAEIRVLPGFSTKTFVNNMAMLRLATPTSTRVQAVAAQGAGAPDGAALVITGWGNAAEGSTSFPTSLRQANVVKLPNSICAAGYGTQFHAASEICVSGAGQDTCSGDSGGAVVTRRAGAWVQVGIGRLSDGCGKNPATYTRVEAFGNWIRQQISPGTVSSASVSVNVSATRVAPGTTVYLTGAVKPAKSTPSVVLQRSTGGRWVDGGTAAVNQSSGAYRLSIKPTATGSYTMRVRSSRGGAVSRTVTLTVALPTAVKPPTPQCDPNYTPCVPIASDVDCAGGSGDGPAYVQGPVKVIGTDIYHLDTDHDGIGCE